VDTPQEPQQGRILTFPQGLERTSGAAPRCPIDDAADEDRLVEEVPSNTGEAIVSHLRALPLGVSSGAFYPHTATEEVPEAAAALGLHTVEIMLQTAGEYDPGFIAALADRVHDVGVTVRSVHTMQRLHPLMDPYQRRVREGRELFERGIEAAAALNANVLVWQPSSPSRVTGNALWRSPRSWRRPAGRSA
jgi:hypothetical protein